EHDLRAGHELHAGDERRRGELLAVAGGPSGPGVAEERAILPDGVGELEHVVALHGDGELLVLLALQRGVQRHPIRTLPVVIDKSQTWWQHTHVAAKRGSAISVLVVDDHRTFAEALAVAFRLEKDLAVQVVSNGTAAVAAVGRDRPDVVLMDLEMPGVGGVEAIRRLRESQPTALVIVFSGHQENLYKDRAVAAGAVGTHVEDSRTRLALHTKSEALAVAIRHGKIAGGSETAASAGLSMKGVAPAPPAVLPELHPVAVVLPVLHRGVVTTAALGARHRDLRPVIGLRHLSSGVLTPPGTLARAFSLVAAGGLEPPTQRLLAACLAP